MEALELNHQFQRTSEIIQLDGVDVYVIHPGIVVSHYTKDIELDMALALDINKVIGELTYGKSAPQLFIACPGLTVSKEVREWGTTETTNRYTSRSDVVCNTLAHRIIGNFLIRVQRPPRPSKMFSSLEEGIKWLIN